MTSHRRFLLLATAVAAHIAAPAAAQHTAPDPNRPLPTWSTAPVGAAGADAWRDDLRALIGAIRHLHPEPDWRVPAARLDSAVADLDAAIPDLPAHRIVVEFARIAAMIGDGHTSLPLYFAPGVDFHVLPYRLGIYEEGLFVEAADRSIEGIVGGRVLAIGGVPVDEAMHRVIPLVSRDNDNWIAAVAPHLLNRMEVLHALGLARDLGSVELTVVVDGRTVRRAVEPLAERRPMPYGIPFLARLSHDWVDAREAAGVPMPLHQQHFDSIYGWRYLPEHDLLYVKFDQVQNRAHGPSALAVFREAMAFAREHAPERTVIDVRNNTGGEGGILSPIVREIVRTREIDEPGRLFVVIGRRTFSAAQDFVAQLERYTSAVLVGEPSSAFYNGYAGHVSATLPNSGIVVNVSPDYYQMGAFPRDRRRQATPRIAAVPTFADYVAGRDPALEAIVDYQPEALARDVEAALEADDSAGAAAALRAFDRDPRNRYTSSTARVNALGYRLLNEGRVDEAIAVFRLNVAVHPDYANGWDSLGEALVRADRRADAIAAFRRALSLDPEAASPRAWLRRLGAEAG